MKRTPAILVLLAVLFQIACSGAMRSPGLTSAAASAPAATGRTTPMGPELSTPIPLDGAVRHGRLDNGLVYYVRRNAKPEHRADLRLAVNAGSTLEDDDQRGLAHFVEHMAFNGTKNFAKQELIDYLERVGMRFGPDINAYTGFDETVYLLEIPTDDAEIVKTGLQILEDWAHQVTFEGEEIDKERGVVIEEWRQGRGASGRIRDQQLPVLFQGSRYADRIVIGDREVLAKAPHEALRRFYRDWYRPELMAVVAVGDFDPAAMESQIREQFSRIRPSEKQRERVEYAVPDHDETRCSVVTDPEATSIQLAVGYKRPPISTETVGDLRQSLVDGLYHRMMNDRLQELSQKADPPYQSAYSTSGRLGRTKAIYRLSAAAREGGVERGLETLLTESRRVERHGFTPSELARAKTDLLRAIERQYEERDKQESSRFAGEYVQHFLEDNPAPGIEYLRDRFEMMIPGITLEEVDARADQWISQDNRVILVSGPETERAGIPDESELLAVFEGVERLDVVPWIDRVRDEPLVAVAPAPGRVIAESTVEGLGVTRWKLSNGTTVLLKPSDFKNDEILIRGYSPGGHSLSSDEHYISASLASDVVSEMGAGAFDSIELEKALAGKVAAVQSSISELSESVRGSASVQDLETMLQLLYLKFTGARRDDDAFQAYLTRTENTLQNREASPDYQFSSKFSETFGRSHLRRLRLTPERLRQLDLERALAFYRERFGDASDFLFTLVGNLDLASVRPLVETWIGGLPSAGRQDQWRDVGVEAPEGVSTFEVRKGIEPKSQVRITFHGPAEWSPREAHILSSTAEVLRIRLRELLREDMGGVYGVGVFGSIHREPRQRYSFTVSFGCDPERVDELRAAVFAEVETVKEDGPGAGYVEKVREAQIRQRETDLERNTFWVYTLEYHERYGLDLMEILRYEDLVAAVTEASVQEAARRYLSTERYLEGVLYPEGAGGGSVPDGLSPGQGLR